jgi:hypothetical protein
MTTIAKTTRAALAVAVLALATAGAASADVQNPTTHANPSDYASPAGSSWSSITPAGWKWAPESRIARFHPNVGGCMRGCVI